MLLEEIAAEATISAFPDLFPVRQSTLVNNIKIDSGLNYLVICDLPLISLDQLRTHLRNYGYLEYFKAYYTLAYESGYSEPARLREVVVGFRYKHEVVAFIINGLFHTHGIASCFIAKWQSHAYGQNELYLPSFPSAFL